MSGHRTATQKRMQRKENTQRTTETLTHGDIPLVPRLRAVVRLAPRDPPAASTASYRPTDTFPQSSATGKKGEGKAVLTQCILYT